MRHQTFFVLSSCFELASIYWCALYVAFIKSVLQNECQPEFWNNKAKISLLIMATRVRLLDKN